MSLARGRAKRSDSGPHAYAHSITVCSAAMSASSQVPSETSEASAGCGQGCARVADGMFESSTIIVAHPDDEVLWLGSVLPRVGNVVFCFNDFPPNPSLGVARKKSIAEYPLANAKTLDICEPESFGLADWKRPAVVKYGLKLTKNRRSNVRYRDTYERLVNALRAVVADAKNVFSHNPWGEYGHEDHVLVHQALNALRAEFGYDLWFSNYCSTRSLGLMNKYISGFAADYVRLAVDLDLARRVAEVYRSNGCWTWHKDYQWFDDEYLMKAPPSGGRGESLRYGRLFPINYLKGSVGPHWSPWRRRLAKVAGPVKRRLWRLLQKE